MTCRLATLAVVAITLPGCDGSAPEKARSEGRAGAVPQGGAVLYTIGVSTDPYGDDQPNGFGVATGLVADRLEKLEVRSPDYGWFGGAEWLDRGRILVHRKAPPLRRPAIFRLLPGRLELSGHAPFFSGSAYRWSPDRQLLALEPPAPCKPRQRSLFRCYRGGGQIFVARADGSDKRQVAKGVSPGWSPDGRLVLYRTRRDWARGRAVLLDVATGKKSFRDRYWVDERPLASPDGRYRADRRGTKTGGSIVVTTVAGRVLHRIRTPYIVSMFAWSPRGDRLAYTTSGFPDPHELFLIDAATGTHRRVFATGARHFDWITWSPDGRWLLLDGDEIGNWHVFSAKTGKQVRRLPRLGGRPVWCCPVNAADLNGGRLG
jgi:WD40 repeat protein